MLEQSSSAQNYEPTSIRGSLHFPFLLSRHWTSSFVSNLSIKAEYWLCNIRRDFCVTTCPLLVFLVLRSSRRAPLCPP